MSQVRPSTRRDARIELPARTAWVEFEWQGPDRQRLRGEVASISATGLAFALADDPVIEVGAFLTPASVCINERIVRGDLSVRFCRSLAGSRIEVGSLFYPASLEDSAAWMLLVKQLSSDGSSPPPHLALRCSNCHSVVWICATDRSGHPCPACDQEYGFGKPLRRGRLDELHQRAREMAAELKIDLPSAVSMLLEILTLSEVRDILDEAPPAEPATAEPDEARKLGFDRAFVPAIEAGTLTEVQARQRGNREAFARSLVARHQISLDQAYAVADNRISLLSIVRERKAGAPITTTYRRPTTAARPLLVAGFAGIAVLVGVGSLRSFDDAFNRQTPETHRQQAASDVRSTGTGASSVTPAVPDPAELPVESYARVRTNERGEISRVEAMDPGNALRAFCVSHEPHRRLEPVDVVQTDPPSDVVRIGLLRDLDTADGYRVVVIRRDPQTRRWLLGNADNPDARVSMFPAPERLVQAARNPL